MNHLEISSDVIVNVSVVYNERESSAVEARYIFLYNIEIINKGLKTVQLLRRYWNIHDSIGYKYEVEGEGVIGKQPIIQPGERYHYQSFCLLKSYSGSMEGYYILQDEDQQLFKALIPKFLLKSHLLN
jgi:ApaG protein